MSENVLGFWHNEVGRVAKTAFHVTRTTFGVYWTVFQKKYNFNIFPTFSDIFSKSQKKNPPVVSSPQHSRPQKLQKNWSSQEGFLRVRRSLTFRVKKSGSNQNYLTYGQWAKKRCFVGEMFLAELLTPHSICSAEKNFETKGFFPKKICLTFFSAFEWRNSGFVAEVFNKGVKNNIHVTRGTFW